MNKEKISIPPNKSRLAINKLAQKLWSARMLVGLMVLGLVLRVWGISYGLPYLYHADEPLVQNSLVMVKTNDLNPHFFGYGSLFFYINAIAYWGYFLLGRIIGLFSSVADIPNLEVFGLGIGRSLMPSQIIAGRLVSVIIGTMCIPISYWLGVKLSGRRVGVLSALFVAFSAPLVDHSQYITPNILATFTILLTLAVLVHSANLRPNLASLFIGVALGCAVASKYNAAFLILPLGATFFLQYGWRMIKRPTLYASLAVAVLTFLVVTPYAILDFSNFWTDTIFHLQYYRVNSHPGMEGNTVNYYLSFLVRQTGLLVFLSIFPLIGYIRNRNRTGLILASFALPYIAYIATVDIRNDRTILLVLPILLIMAADALDLTRQRILKSHSLRTRQLALALLTTFVFLSTTYLVYRTAESNIRKTTIDARELARQWIETNVPAGTSVAMESYSPFLSPSKYSLDYFPTLINNSPDWYRQERYDLLVFSSDQYARFYADPDRYAEQVSMYDALWESFPEVKQFELAGTTIRIYQVND
ncbi:MAG: glycosyltransferase family 39 protein [Ardenticatenales bacterium]|nr:glycosyltransferase family 39 protein [Ardenticatenales bacterium]